MLEFGEATNMAKTLVLVIGSFALFSGTVALQGCSDTSPYGYGPSYYSSPGYYSERGYYAGNGYVGDYNENSYWRDRDMNNDARAIRQGQANIRHDKQELREDLEHHDYSAAAHEQAEIHQRRANVRARQADLNADLSGY
jgi:hypothetical protein